MKKLLFVTLIGILALGCKSDPASEPPHLEFSENTLTVSYIGGETRVNLTHNYVWEAYKSMGSDWLSFTSGSPDGGVTPIIITTTENETGQQREATISFFSKNLTKVITITQEVQTGEVSQDSISFDHNGGDSSLTFTTNVPEWNLSITPGVTWCSVTKETTGEITVTAEPNFTDNERSAVITIKADEITREVTVTQNMFIFQVTPSVLSFRNDGEEKQLTVTTNATEGWTWAMQPAVDWCSVEKRGLDKLVITTTENSVERRTASIIVTADGISKSINLTQSNESAYADKEVVQLQHASIGSGIDIVIMGDGYIASDMTIGDGKYEKDMTAAMEHFFSVYPYNYYREYFNVWMVGAVSNEAGISTEQPRKDVDTVFDCVWEGPSSGSTGIDVNRRTAREYATLVGNVTGKGIDYMTVIMPINAYIYAGTCHMDARGSEFSISLCPVGNAYKEVVIHEAGGHGVAKLMDEYVYYDQTIPNYIKESFIETKEALGWFINIDFSKDILQTTWADFAGKPEYDMVGTFEGSYMYQYGIWRPEYNSCMNNNVFYFNAPSRYAQMQRIHEWAGFEYSFEQFLQDDIIPPYPSNQQRTRDGVSAPFVPFASPVLALFD